jgi:uncharacterized protein
MSALLISAFALGIVSNLHCLGMCGPLVLALPIKNTSKKDKVYGIILYNSGRLLTYGILGSIVGVIGLGIQLIGVLQGLSIISGILIILFAWHKKLFQPKHTNWLQKFSTKAFGKTLKMETNWKYLAFGSINGILPCGMVYTALLTAVLADSVLEAFGVMLAFGIGTLPIMVVLPYLSQQFPLSLRHKLSKAVPFLVTLVGCLIIMRGLNLNIPYLSPKASVKTQTEEVKMECCHRK